MVERPQSAVSLGSGMAGTVALVALLAIGIAREWNEIAMIYIVLLGTAFASAMWDILVDKVHRRPSTGMDWSNPRAVSEIADVVAVKLLGLVATFAFIAFGYGMFHTYQDATFRLYFWTLKFVLPFLLLICPIYVLMVTRYMIEPHDKLWHFGRFVLGKRDGLDMDQVKDHVLGWCVKSFFLAFLFSVIPGVFPPILEFSSEHMMSGIIPFFLTLVGMLFFLDVVFGTFGYFMTFRPLDSHIRSANPYLAAWVFALICYPPFTAMSGNGMLNYHVGGEDWRFWLADAPIMLVIWGVAMTVLTALYAFETVIFGIRFSNLTHRGIITVGPYRYFKHPAYLSKNVYWWFAAMPFLSTSDDPMSAIRNSILLLLVNGVYFMRAKTEERHLMADPDYQAYSAWIAENGVIPKLRRRLFGAAPVSATNEASQ